MKDVKVYMSVNSIIVGAMSSIVPTAHDKYTGTAKTYALFSIYNNLPAVFASGRNHKIEAYGDIDVFSDIDLSGSNSLIDAIENALKSANVSVKDIRDVEYDNVSHHKLIEYYISKKR